MRPLDLVFSPIGIFSCRKKYPYETASQGTLDQSDEVGCIELFPGQNYEQALCGLEDMSHLWVIYSFHQKSSWNPKVRVPRGSSEKCGVFSTRSPHRPNSIGLSLVEIVKVEGRQLWIKKFDLLDRSPILDLKPFHPTADRAERPRLGWMQSLESDQHRVHTTPEFDREIEFLNEQGLVQILPFCQQQLSYDPLNHKKKRVRILNEGLAEIAYRTWRIRFAVKDQEILLLGIFSGYRQEELLAPEDKWNDKKLHLLFLAKKASGCAP